MKVGILSDTHGYIDPKLSDFFKDCDELWHGGDWGNLETTYEVISQWGKRPIRGVYGNIDGAKARQIFPEHFLFIADKLRVYITHIGGYPGRYTPGAKSHIVKAQPQLFICGHSHILKVIRDPKQNNLLHINPGAAGNIGFHLVRTAIRLDINAGQMSNLEVIELGARSLIADEQEF
jgi:putative phosphoesterase